MANHFDLTFQDSYKIRILLIDNQPWFVASDVCEALSIVNTTRALSRLDEDEKGIHTMNTLGGEQKLSTINESGLYSLVLTSRKAEAKKFKKWVTNEVLPQIRKTGSYQQPQYTPEAPELFSHSDTDNLARLVWHISRGFGFEQSWSNAVWFALRDVTGTPSPERFEVRHIPLIAQECRRIYYIASQLRGINQEAEKQTIKRLLRKREDADRVLAEIKQLFSERLHQQRGAVSDRLGRWHEGEVMKFLHRH